MRRDTTISVRGQLFELDHGYLAGRTVTVAYCLLDEPLAPVVEVEGRRLPLRLVDPVHNAHVKRPPRHVTRTGASPTGKPAAFDPGGALRDKAARDAALADEADDIDGEEDLDAIF